MTGTQRDVKPARSAEERVRWFLEDFQEQHRIAAPWFTEDSSEENDAFDKWKKLIGPVQERHFTVTSHTNLGSRFSSLPEYGSRPDEFVRTDAVSTSTGDFLHVVFASESHVIHNFHEYIVVTENDDFRISEVETHMADPKDPFLDAGTIAERHRGSRPNARLLPPPEEEAHLDHHGNFIEREVANIDGERSRVVVQQVGEFTTRSGVLSAYDYGWDNHTAEPLARTVPPGTYPVDRVMAYGNNAAVRVRFSDATPVSWWLANRLDTENDQIGVDAGCIYIADYPAYASMSPRAKAVAYQAFDETENPSVAPVLMHGDHGEAIGIAIASGWGDGRYPAYWGLSADGKLAQLVVDFKVLSGWQDERFRYLGVPDRVVPARRGVALRKVVARVWSALRSR